MALESNIDNTIGLSSITEVYREGYLDSYNRFKVLLKESINKPVETTNEQSLLTEIESNWLKYELEARNQEFGYEPNDISIRNSIFEKLRLKV